MPEITVVAVRKKHQIGSLADDALPDLFSRLTALDNMSCRVFRKSKESEMRLRQSEKPATFSLLLLPHARLLFKCRGRAERILNSAGARTEDFQVDRIAVISEVAQGHANLIEVVGVRSENEYD